MFLINCPCILAHDSDGCPKCRGLGVAVYQWRQLRPLTDAEILAAGEALVADESVEQTAEAA